MRILENNALDAQRKRNNYNNALNNCLKIGRDNLKDLSKLDDLHALTAQIKARHGSMAQELRDMRVSLVR